MASYASQVSKPLPVRNEDRPPPYESVMENSAQHWTPVQSEVGYHYNQVGTIVVPQIVPVPQYVPVPRLVPIPHLVQVPQIVPVPQEVIVAQQNVNQNVGSQFHPAQLEMDETRVKEDKVGIVCGIAFAAIFIIVLFIIIWRMAFYY